MRLARKRRWRLARLKLDWLEWLDGGGDPDDLGAVRAFVEAHSDLEGYDDKSHEVRVALQSGSALKCVWCEGEISRSEPLDHFRPRRWHPLADGQASVVAEIHHRGYWWLTWSYDNLVPTCATCHGPKGTRFPLAAGGVRCQPFEVPDDATELSLLIDPSREDPAALVEYVVVDADGNLIPPSRLGGADPTEQIRFVPRARVADPRVEETFKVTGLLSRGLDGNWEKHIRPIREYDITPLRRAIERGDAPEGIRRLWRKLVRRYVADSNANRRALTRAVLDFYFPRAERDRLGLSPLPSLEDPSPAESRLPLFDSTPLRARNERLALAVEACGSGQKHDFERGWRVFEGAGETIEALADALAADPDALRQRLGLA